MFNSSQFSAFATFYIYVQPFYIHVYVQQIGDRSKHCVEVFWFMYIYIWCQYICMVVCVNLQVITYVNEFLCISFFRIT